MEARSAAAAGRAGSWRHRPASEGQEHLAEAGDAASGFRSEARRSRIQSRDSTFRRLLALADIAAVSVGLVVAALILGSHSIRPGALILPLAAVSLAKLIGLYDRDQHLIHKTTMEEVPLLFAACGVLVLGLTLAEVEVVGAHLRRTEILVALLVTFGSMVLLRAFARRVAVRATPGERCLLVGDLSRRVEVETQLALGHSTDSAIVGTVEPTPEGEEADPLAHTVERYDIDRVILAPGREQADEVMFAIHELKSTGVKVSILPDISRIAGSSIHIDRVGGLTLLGVSRFEFTRSSLVMKRLFDMLVALGILVVLAPLMIAIAIAIKLDSRGPVFFRQSRIGRNGKRFLIYKFRSMEVGADGRKPEVAHLDRGGDGFFKAPDDPRVTRVGAFIRSTALDELPQLVNVLRGEMSLVGPRPLIPEEDERISGEFRSRRLSVAPGMTGHWQVLGSSSKVPLDDMVRLDYLYVANWSLWTDVVLMVRTFPIVFSRQSL